MHRRTFAIALPILIIVASIFVGGYAGFGAYRSVVAASEAAAREQARISRNETRLRSALTGISGLSSTDLANGFWYTYRDGDGNESVFYFDLRFAAEDDLSDEQIERLKRSISESSVASARALADVTEASLTPELRFHNALYESTLGGSSTVMIGNELKQKIQEGSATSDDLFRLSYLSELEGDYATRDALNHQNCEAFNERCSDPITLTLKGMVVDAKGDPVQGASVDIVSRPQVASVTTDHKGEYAIQTGAKEMEKIRIHAHKRNFSDGYTDHVVLAGTPNSKTYQLDTIQLESPLSIVTIDHAKKSVTGIGNRYSADGSVDITTSQSTYHIPAGAIVRRDGTPYTGDVIDVYLYEFTKGAPPPNLLEVDTFDEVMGYAGDLMKSFGMPYIQFFSLDGEELHVLSSNPMSLTYRIPDMDALYQNTDRIYRELTDADMEFLVRASAGGGLPIDREFLIANQMLQFPAFWVFDRARGVWDNVGQAVLDTQGTIRTVFYTLRSTL